MGKLSRWKINKETLNSSYVLHQTNLTDIYRTSHPKPTEYTFFTNILYKNLQKFTKITNILYKNLQYLQIDRTLSEIDYTFNQNRCL